MPLVTTRGGASALGFGFGGFFAAGVGGDFESIATANITSSSLPSLTSIPQTYQHLQIRAFIRFDAADGIGSLYLSFNDDTTSGSYSYHGLYGNGSSVQAIASTPQTHIWCGYGAASPTKFGVFVIDILDYSSTTKNKTVRTLSGGELGSSGRISVSSSAWYSTAAINKIGTYGGGYNIAAGTIALYGVGAP